MAAGDEHTGHHNDVVIEPFTAPLTLVRPPARNIPPEPGAGPDEMETRHGPLFES